MKGSIDYPALTTKALRRIIRDTLALVAETGLPQPHHFFISFRTDHPGTTLPERLRAAYPETMTIVLEHEFWDLVAGDAAFSVTLSFQRKHERLTIPYDAVTAFVDPGVTFGLQFEEGPGASLPPEPPQRPVAAAPEGGANVIALDQFRKK